MNVAVVAPAGILTVVLSQAGFDEFTGIGNPVVGAVLVRLMTPVRVLPPLIEVGLNVSDFSVGAVMASVVARLSPLSVAVRVAVTSAATARVVTVKVVLVLPAGMVTRVGTVASPTFEDSPMSNPLAGAAEEIVIVPVDETPPTTLVGETFKLVIFGARMLSVPVAE